MRGRISWLWLLISTPTRWPVWTKGNRMQSIGNTLIAKEETVNHFTLAVVVRAETQLYESITQLRTLPDQLTSYARTKVSCLVYNFFISFHMTRNWKVLNYFPNYPDTEQLWWQHTRQAALSSSPPQKSKKKASFWDSRTDRLPTYANVSWAYSSHDKLSRR